MADDDAVVPSEDDTLLGGDNGNDFDIDRFDTRVKAGKYDGHLILMTAMLHDRAISENRRRWRCTFRDVAYLEDDVDGEVAEHAERFAGQGWGLLTALLGDNVRATIRPARAVLYGICRAELGMDHRTAARTIKMPAKDILACFDWYEVDPPGKSEAET